MSTLFRMLSALSLTTTTSKSIIVLNHQYDAQPMTTRMRLRLQTFPKAFGSVMHAARVEMRFMSSWTGRSVLPAWLMRKFLNLWLVLTLTQYAIELKREQDQEAASAGHHQD